MLFVIYLSSLFLLSYSYSLCSKNNLLSPIKSFAKGSYHIVPLKNPRHGSFLRLSDDNPSDIEDSGSNNSLGSQTIEVTPISASFAKDVLISEMDNDSLTRIEVNEYVLALEKENPTPNPANSKKLNGVWELAVSGFGTPGLVAYQALKLLPERIVKLQDVTLTISSVAPRVTTSTMLKGGPLQLDISVITDIESVSGSRIKETYKSGKIGSLDIPLSSISSFTRELIISYLDDDLLIARDCFGGPEILRRKAGASPKLGDYDIPLGSDDAPGASA